MKGKIKYLRIEADVQPPHVITTLPRYVVANAKQLMDPTMYSFLKQKCEPLKFPLSIADKISIAVIMKKFTQQPFYPGLAAPQLGISKQIIVFSVHSQDSDENYSRIKVWLNPSYEKISDEISEEYESCVSVKSVTGFVPRYKHVRYKAYDVKGNLHEGEFSNLTARIIQHEIDHLNGKLYTDYITEGKLISFREFSRKAMSKLRAKDNCGEESSGEDTVQK